MHEHVLKWCIHENYLLKCIAYLASMIMENYEKCFGIQHGYLPIHDGAFGHGFWVHLLNILCMHYEQQVIMHI